MAWLSGWTYRREFKVKHPSGALTNYPIKLNIGYDGRARLADIDCAGLCALDFADLRFTTSDGTTLLDYFIELIEPYTSYPTAVVWIECDSIGTGSTTFYMYFGNALASSLSNGVNTFSFFDHFDDASLDSSKWTDLGGTTESGTTISVLATSGTVRGIVGKTEFGLNYATRMKVKWSHLSTTAYAEGCGWGHISTADQARFYPTHTSTTFNYKVATYLNAGTYTTEAIWGARYEWLIVEVARFSNAKTIFTMAIDGRILDRTFSTALTSNIYAGNMVPNLSALNNNGAIEADWIAVRQYDQVEPQVEGFGHIAEETPVSTGWLSDWAQRIRINISYAQLAASLVNFPIAVKLGSSVGLAADDVTAIFDELGANSLKIAFTTHDGTTQLYAEVASWDNATEKAVIHVKVPHASAIENTYIYLYYDNAKADNSSYVGVTTSTPAKKVWDMHFVGVYHLNETPAGANSILDSTAVGSHGSNTGTASATAQLDKGLDFEKSSSDRVNLLGKTQRLTDFGATGHTPTLYNYQSLPIFSKVGWGTGYFNGSTSYVTFPDHDDWQLGGGTGDFTIEFWVDFHALPSSGNYRMFLSQYKDANNYWFFGLRNNAGAYTLRFQTWVSPTVYHDVEVSWTPSLYTYYHIALTREGNDFKIWVDGNQVGATVTDADSVPNIAGLLNLGRHGAATHYLGGYIDELRISNICRYTAAFTPTIDPYESDANTKLLLHFDTEGASVKFIGSATYEAVFNLESFVASGQNSGLLYESTANNGYTRLGLFTNYQAASDTRLFGGVRDTNTGTLRSCVDTVTLNLATWYYASVAFDHVKELVTLVKNDTLVGSDTVNKGITTIESPYSEVSLGYVPGTSTYYHDGVIDEARISLIERSLAWRYATYKTLFDILLTYEDTELMPTTAAPTTVAPTTLAPTTLLPTTLAPTTLLVSTPVPTTTLTTPAPSLGGGRLVNAKLLNKLILLGRLVQ